LWFGVGAGGGGGGGGDGDGGGDGEVIIKTVRNLSKLQASRCVLITLPVPHKHHTGPSAIPPTATNAHIQQSNGQCHLQTTSIRPPPSADVNVGLSADTSHR
jgi:hypothetical protein